MYQKNEKNLVNIEYRLKRGITKTANQNNAVYTTTLQEIKIKQQRAIENLDKIKYIELVINQSLLSMSVIDKIQVAGFIDLSNQFQLTQGGTIFKIFDQKILVNQDKTTVRKIINQNSTLKQMIDDQWVKNNIIIDSYMIDNLLIDLPTACELNTDFIDQIFTIQMELIYDE